tara:strand:+ start:1334 stop:1486 length:153 start_codon:yes stop_codon:yes gene_type:complete
MRKIVMKKINYRLVQERVYLAIALVKLAQEVLVLLNMAFNYKTNVSPRYA